jgi:hypothetical protein
MKTFPFVLKRLQFIGKENEFIPFYFPFRGESSTVAFTAKISCDCINVKNIGGKQNEEDHCSAAGSGNGSVPGRLRRRGEAR